MPGSGRRLSRYANILPLILGHRSVVSLKYTHIQALLARDAKVYMAARNEAKASATIQELRAETGRTAIFLKLDLANLRSIKAAAAEFMRQV